jgi:hypothetical protein
MHSARLPRQRSIIAVDLAKKSGCRTKAMSCQAVMQQRNPGGASDFHRRATASAGG